MAWQFRPELLFEEFSRSSGPGGQNVNRRETRVSATYRFGDDDGLSDAQQDRIRVQSAQYLVDENTLRVSVSSERSQGENRRIARERLAQIILRSLRAPKKRRPTKPTRASKEKRLSAKRKQSEKKQFRKSPRE